MKKQSKASCKVADARLALKKKGGGERQKEEGSLKEKEKKTCPACGGEDYL